METALGICRMEWQTDLFRAPVLGAKPWQLRRFNSISNCACSSPSIAYLNRSVLAEPDHRAPLSIPMTVPLCKELPIHMWGCAGFRHSI